MGSRGRATPLVPLVSGWLALVGGFAGPAGRRPRRSSGTNARVAARESTPAAASRGSTWSSTRGAAGSTTPHRNGCTPMASTTRAASTTGSVDLTSKSLGWVTATDNGQLTGFVHVAWDGADHAFLLDTVVARTHRRQGIGIELVRRATLEVRNAGIICPTRRCSSGEDAPARLWVPARAAPVPEACSPDAVVTVCRRDARARGRPGARSASARRRRPPQGGRPVRAGRRRTR
jgi:GNAT superfamily N-acetyltransferase